MIKKFLSALITKLVNILNYIIIKLNKKYNLTVNAVIYNDSGRFYQYLLTNNNLLSHKDVLKGIYNTLMSDETFKNFGFHKVIIVSALLDGHESNYHHNILITNNTTFEQYYYKVKDIIATHFDNGYQLDVVQGFKILVWNMDSLANKNIKITSSTVKNYKPGVKSSKAQIRNIHTSNMLSKTKNLNYTHITPLKMEVDTTSSFATMDIETMNYNSKQIPVAISIFIPNVGVKIFIIDYTIDLDLAIDKLWKQFFDYLINTYKGVIFIHNLGNFDGYFLYKALSNYAKPTDISTIVDDHNEFIQIKLSNLITWKDSYRIFPVLLNELCKVFGVEGKSSEYNPKFNDLSLFNNQDLLKDFIEYSKQDSISLFNALSQAQDIYISEYGVDITTVLSTSTLSLKIFRLRYLKHNIPTLKGSLDNFIRKGYFGGATDYYKAFATNLKYYDVNSLYPFAMSNPMPFEMIRYHHGMSFIKLENFFGFCLALIECPLNIKRPVLPYKHLGKTIYPNGTWLGVYFSEELKAVEKLGYKITLIKGYEFSKMNLFSTYINDFYTLKRNSVGPQRFIAKMHLNQLYGYFGRRLDLIETVNVYNNDLHLYLTSRIVKSIIKINDHISTLLLYSNINHDLINELNTKLDLDLISSFKLVKSNVAIASAVTSYARIVMIEFKILCQELNIAIYYTDTDSFFTDKPLPNNFIGTDLGLMKDELDGLTIDKAYFLGIKKYGYRFIKDNQVINKSVFSGIERDSLTFDEVEKIVDGLTITKNIENRFYKSFINLDVTIRPTKITIKQNNNKKLVNNLYLPLTVFNLNNALDNRSKFIKFANKIHKY
jgi:DNA polymerase type B, organellar and viral